jgi:flagellar biosynthesis protein FlhG
LSIALARQGQRVVLVDADMRQADVATLCQLDVRETITDVLSARRTVHEVLHRGPAGIQVLAGMWPGTGVPDCSPAAQQRLLAELNRLGRHADLIVLDVGSGLDHVVRRFWQAADCILLVATPDRVAIMDAYASIKVLDPEPASETLLAASSNTGAAVQTIINRADAEAARAVHARIDHACERFLNRRVLLAGHVSEDPRIAQQAAIGRPFALDGSALEACFDLENIAAHVLAQNQAASKQVKQPVSPSALTAA